MADKQKKKQEVLYYLGLDKKKLETMGEQDLINVITKVEEIRNEAVKEARYLGRIIRRGQLQAKAQAAA